MTFYDSETMQVRSCYEYSWDSTGSAGIARILSRMHHDLQEFIEKYCTDVTNQLRISLEYSKSGTNKNVFLTFPVGFSRKIGYKKAVSPDWASVPK